MSDDKQPISDDAYASQRYKFGTHLQFTLARTVMDLTAGMISANFFYFYETVIDLPVALVALAWTIFGFWDALNDPLVAFISEKPNKMWRKWGRRAPWIVIGVIPTAATLVLLFTPPKLSDPSQQIWIIVYLIAVLLVHEFSYTLISCNHISLFAEKFRSQKERSKNATIGMLTSMLSYFMGLTLGSAFLNPDPAVIPAPEEYLLGAAGISGLAIIFFLIGLPGLRETQEMKERAIAAPSLPFFKSIGTALKNRNFRVATFASFSYQVFTSSITASITFVVRDVFQDPDLVEIGIIAPWFFALMLSAPIWMLINRKLGNKITYLGGMLAIVIVACTIFLFQDSSIFVIWIAIIGFLSGSAALSTSLIFSDVVDDATLISKKRQESLYSGVLTFFNRLGLVVQGWLFALVHSLTNYETAPSSAVAQTGILSLMSWIPGIFLLIAVILLFTRYNISVKKSFQTKLELKEMGL